MLFTMLTSPCRGITRSTTVPTLMAVVDGREMARTVGWDRRSWEALSGADDLGAGTGRDAAWLRIALG